MYLGLHVKYPLLLSDFNETWFFFLDRFSKNTQISNFMKIRPAGAELFHVDRQTWRTDEETDRHDEANSRFSQFCERAKKICLSFWRKYGIGKIQGRGKLSLYLTSTTPWIHEEKSKYTFMLTSPLDGDE
jgi:hypothetical protein